MKKKLALAATVLSLLAVPLSATASAAALAPLPVSAMANSSGCWDTWTVKDGAGFASGRCFDFRTVVGTVTDDAADGRCPLVQGRTNTGGLVSSDWAGPKWDTSPVNLRAPEGQWFDSLHIVSIWC
jgi:hypothetical protein